MKASAGFGFFLLFLAGIALVSFISMSQRANTVPTVLELSATAWRPSNIGEMKVDSDSEMYVQFAADGQLLARCPDFTVDAARGRYAAGHFVRRFESLPFSVAGMRA